MFIFTNFNGPYFAGSTLPIQLPDTCAQKIPDPGGLLLPHPPLQIVEVMSPW